MSSGGLGSLGREDRFGSYSGPGSPRRLRLPDGVARGPGSFFQASGSSRWTVLLLEVFGDDLGWRLAPPTFLASSSPDTLRPEGGLEGVPPGPPQKIAACCSARARRSASGPGRPRDDSILRVGAGTEELVRRGSVGGGGAFKGRW